MKHTTRLISLLLALLLCIGIFPTVSLAAVGDLTDIWVGGVQMKSGYYLPSGNNPTAASLTKTRPSGGYAYLKDIKEYSSYDKAVLVLHDYSYNGTGYTKGDITSNIYNTMSAEIVLEGKNTLSGAKYGIYGDENNGYIDISANSPAESLTIRADEDGIHTEKGFSFKNGAVDISAGDAGISSNFNLSFWNGKVTAAAQTGVFSAANIIVYGGTVVAAGDPKSPTSHGLWAANHVSMFGGTVTASGCRFGIECSNHEVAPKMIHFAGGTLTAYNSYGGTPVGNYLGENALGINYIVFSFEGKSFENCKIIAGKDAESAVPTKAQPFEGRYVKIYPEGDDDVGKDDLIPQNLHWNGKDARWDAVPGATKYLVNLYREGMQQQTKVVTDAKCELLTGFSYEYYYQFTVAAYVDGSYHKTSGLSPKATYDSASGNPTITPWGVISSVAVNSTQEPVVGDMVNWNAPTLPAGANYEFNQYGGQLDYAWVEHTGSITDYEDLYSDSVWYRYDDRKELTFQDGKCYTLVLGLKAKDGFEFAPISQMTGSVNGTSAELSDFKLAGWGGDTLVLYRTYGKGGARSIASVEVGNAQVPAVGDKIVWSVPTVPKNVGYEVGIFAGLPTYAWVAHDNPISEYEDLFGNTEWYYPDSEKDVTFQADKYYTLVYWLDAKPGYTFAPLGELTGAINGTSARLSDYSIVEYGDETMTLFRCFDKGCTEIPVPVPTNLHWDGKVARWDALGEATGYQVFLYKDGKQEQTHQTAETYWDLSAVLPKLGSGSYTFAVRASTSGEVSAVSPVYQYTAPVEPPTVVNPFTDVKETDYFYQPVLWAVGKGVTNGTTPTTFEPNATCTRAQAVTFLWRASGSPEPGNSNNPFTDVKSGEYYYKAVLWAVEKGITNGTSATTFSPNDTCTRGQIVTFQWRGAGQPTPGSSINPFTDVKSGDYYYNAVLWAVEKGVTNGVSATTFEPNAFCTRGQIVTFLYRQLA